MRTVRAMLKYKLISKKTSFLLVCIYSFIILKWLANIDSFGYALGDQRQKFIPFFFLFNLFYVFLCVVLNWFYEQVIFKYLFKYCQQKSSATFHTSRNFFCSPRQPFCMFCVRGGIFTGGNVCLSVLLFVT